MNAGAVIAAAGKAGQETGFQPLASIGGISAIERIIATFRQAGIEKISVVTGFQADQLEHHLNGKGIVFLRNEKYQTTEMFESACIGLRYMMDKCDPVLFTPVDVPLFTSATVKALLSSGKKLAVPVHDGIPGHPTLISSELIPSILSGSAEQGLRSAYSRCGVPMEYIPVSDKGVLLDTDTPEDFGQLLHSHNLQLIRPTVSVSLSREKLFFDEQTAILLELIEETGSVRHACRRMNLSYSSGWNAIRRLESQVDQVLIVRAQGGSSSRRSHLTEFGQRFLNAYKNYSSAVRQNAASLFDSFFEDIFS